MKKRAAITLEEHTLLAMSIYHIKDSIHALHAFLLDKELSGPEISQLRSMEARLDSLRSKLDSKYHALIDDETFKKLGHIYYSRGNNMKQHVSGVPYPVELDGPRPTDKELHEVVLAVMTSGMPQQGAKYNLPETMLMEYGARCFEKGYLAGLKGDNDGKSYS